MNTELSGNGFRADRLEKVLLRKCLRQFPNSNTILDVGSGTWHFTRWFCELGYEAKGIDSSPAMVKHAQLFGGPEFLLGDAQALKFDDHSFDIVSLITSELPAEVRKGIDDWFRCIGGALVEQNFLDRMRAQGFTNPRVLWSGRNARTGHAASICTVIRAEKA